MDLVMKLTQTLILFTVLAIAAATAVGQSVNPARLKINGAVGLDSSYAQIVKSFGKPVKETKAVHEECAGGREKTVKYVGLELGLMDAASKDGKTFELVSFNVSSAKYTVSGIKVGDTEATVRAKFGKKFTIDKDAAKGETYWTFEMSDRDGPGQTTVSFKNGKVNSISSAFMMC
jgi:hypothetical protein